MSKYEFIIDLNEDTSIDYVIGKLKIHGKVIDVKNVKETRTTQQNSALHLWFTQLAEALNEKHFTVRDILQKSVQVDWTPVLVKEVIWRRLQESMFGKKSTTQLFKSKEIDQLYDTINRVVIERTHGEVTTPPFPCFEDLLNNQE